MSSQIIPTWTDELIGNWGKAPQRIAHTLHAHPLFSLPSLAELIGKYPRSEYSLVEVGSPGQRRVWREGDIGTLTGTQVIDSIAKGRLWLNLRNVHAVDPRFAQIVKQLFDELSSNIPGFQSFDHKAGILISSPRAEVYYHADLPGQSLFQIHGQKRVFIYPPKPPFLNAQDLERIAYKQLELDMHYDRAFDEHATVMDIVGGDFLHWPLNAPHRIENADCLNVSMTIEYWTQPIRRNQMVNLANGILRHRFGLNPKGRSTSGPVFWAKAAFQAGMRRAGFLDVARKGLRPIEFEMVAGVPGTLREL